jgi:hypothetical protein
MDAASAAFAASSSPVAPVTRAEGRAILQAKEWHAGCPVVFSQLRVLTVRYNGFDRRTHWGKLVVNARFAAKLQLVFAKLYAIRFPIHHMQFGDTYGSLSNLPKDGDFTASFECREATASPCTGAATNKTTGSWSMHAYGEAIDLNPVENPYVGCGMTRQNSALLSQSIEHAARHGHAGGDRSVRISRLGLGRLLARVDRGLHALLSQRPLRRVFAWLRVLPYGERRRFAERWWLRRLFDEAHGATGFEDAPFDLVDPLDSLAARFFCDLVEVDAFCSHRCFNGFAVVDEDQRDAFDQCLRPL